MQRPSVGRIVHFTNSQGETCAAIITAVLSIAPLEEGGLPGRCDLTLFPPRKPVLVANNVGFHEEVGHKGTWSWPPRV